MNTYILNSNYVLQDIGKETILLPCGIDNEVDLTKMIVLNETSSLICKYLKTAHSLKDIIDLIIEEYDVSNQDITDIEKFIDGLVDRGIIIKN